MTSIKKGKSRPTSQSFPAEIPEQERWLYQNEKALKSLNDGIKDASEGHIFYLGSFAK